jgi:hypothetical protein
MWADLATLTPSLVVCAAFLIGVALFLRREMSPPRRRPRGGSPDRPPGGSPDAQPDESRHTGDGGTSYSG